MRRALIGQRHGTACVKLSSCLAFHQHDDTARQQREFVFLPRHYVGQIIDAARQMRDFFFKKFNVIHAAWIHCPGARAKPVAPLLLEYFWKKEAQGRA